MAQTSYPFDEQSVTEDQWSAMMTTIAESKAVTGLAVYGDSSGRQVKVPLGTAWVRGHFYSSTAEEVLTIGANASGNPRIDSVVLTLDPTADSIELAVVAGTAAATPVPPTLTQTTTGVYQFPLADVAVANGAATIATADVSTRLRSSRTNSNLLHNCAFNVWQRGTTLDGSAGYKADRWYGYRGSNPTDSYIKQTAAASNVTPAQAMMLQRKSGTSGTSSIAIWQALESVDSRVLAGKTVTLSYWAFHGADYSATIKRIAVQIGTGTGTDQSAQSAGGWTGQASALSTYQTITGSWVRYSHTVTLASTVNQIYVRFDTDAFTGTAGSNDYVAITGVKLEVSDVATGYDHKDYGTEFLQCARYFYSGVGTGGAADSGVLTRFYIIGSFPTVMRTAPQVALSEFKQYNGVALTISGQPGVDQYGYTSSFGTTSTNLAFGNLHKWTGTFSADL